MSGTPGGGGASGGSGPVDSGDTVDTKVLSTKIDKAKGKKVAISTDGSDVLPTVKWTTQAVLNAFNQAITATEAVLNKAGAKQAEVNKAVADLDNAVTTYTNAQKAGTKLDSGDTVDTIALTVASKLLKTGWILSQLERNQVKYQRQQKRLYLKQSPLPNW